MEKVGTASARSEGQLDLILIAQPGSTNTSGKPSTSFVSSLATIAGGQFGCVAIAALAELAIARLLGPAPRGLISLCLMAIGFGCMIGSLGTEATVVVWISKFKNNRTAWFPAVVLWVINGCSLALVAWAILYWKWQPVFLKGVTTKLAFLVLGSIPVSVTFSVLMAMLVGEERFRLRSLIALMNRLASLLAFLICVPLLGRTAETAIVGNLVGVVVGVWIAGAYLQHFFRGAWKIQDARQQLIPTMLFGIRGQLGTLASFFSYRLDVFVVNYFLDTSQVGLYALGVIISEALWQLPAIVAVALFPRTARTLQEGAEAFTCMILRQVSFITIVAALLIAATSPFVIPLVFGARFAPSVPVIWWILPGTVALAVGKVIAADLTARGLNIHLPISAFIGLALTLMLDFILIPKMGIQGAALASSVAYLGAAIYLLVVMKRALQTSWNGLLLPSVDEMRAYPRFWSQFRNRYQQFWR